MRGANDAGIDSAFVCWGIHAADLGIEPGSDAVPLGDGRLEAFLGDFGEGGQPTFVLPVFK